MTALLLRQLSLLLTGMFRVSLAMAIRVGLSVLVTQRVAARFLMAVPRVRTILAMFLLVTCVISWGTFSLLGLTLLSVDSALFSMRQCLWNVCLCLSVYRLVMLVIMYSLLPVCVGLV